MLASMLSGDRALGIIRTKLCSGADLPTTCGRVLLVFTNSGVCKHWGSVEEGLTNPDIAIISGSIGCLDVVCKSVCCESLVSPVNLFTFYPIGSSPFVYT